MAAGLLLTTLFQEDERTPAFAGLCKRLRFRPSDCQRCLDVCPENAIALEPGPVINDRCSRCGLCQTACPTEVFQGEAHTDQYLLSRIGPFPTTDQPRGSGQQLFIHCWQAEKQDRNSFQIPCLSSITENFMLGVASQGVDALVLTKGVCSRCRLHKGEQSLDDAVVAFHGLSQSIGLKNFALTLNEKPREEKTRLGRRAFFSSLSGPQESSAWSDLAPDARGGRAVLMSTPERHNPTRASPKRAFLQALLDKTARPESAVFKYDRKSSWAKIRINANNCATCGICVALCPTGSISRKIENGQLSHFFNSSRCNNCRLCEEACPEKVISFEEYLPLNEMLDDEAKAVTRISLSACLVCGEAIPPKEGKLCITCRKRQMGNEGVG